MHRIIAIDNAEDWLSIRSKGIGGSDAAAIIGKNPYKSNLDLWREKTGREKPDDVSNVDAVYYGKKAEEPLRQIFMLDYPQYVLKYEPFNIHCNSQYDFIRGTFDGELITKMTKFELGLLEIKTTEIRQQKDWQKWNNRVPDNYFCQVLHYFAIDTEYKFCKLKAQIKHYDENEEVIHTTKHYHFDREKFKEDIEYLINEEIKFNWYIENDKEPPLRLPEI
ncbi:YqaJ viral recombinase family protein [bacterium]|nr:YqaJ viral recombinase family protein [bacterium]